MTSPGFVPEGAKLKQQEREQRRFVCFSVHQTLSEVVVVETPVDGPTLGQGEKTSSQSHLEIVEEKFGRAVILYVSFLPSISTFPTFGSFH